MALSKRIGGFALLLILLAPSIWFGLDYLSNSYSLQSKQHRYTYYDESSSIDMTVSYPSYLVSGQPIPVNLSLRVHFSYPYEAIAVDGVGAEIRDASRTNATTNLVEEWRTLLHLREPIGRNYTDTIDFSKMIYIAAAYPPSTVSPNERG